MPYCLVPVTLACRVLPVAFSTPNMVAMATTMNSASEPRVTAAIFQGSRRCCRRISFSLRAMLSSLLLISISRIAGLIVIVSAFSCSFLAFSFAWALRAMFS